jgi:hypothetical protein
MSGLRNLQLWITAQDSRAAGLEAYESIVLDAYLIAENSTDRHLLAVFLQMMVSQAGEKLVSAQFSNLMEKVSDISVFAAMPCGNPGTPVTQLNTIVNEMISTLLRLIHSHCA